MTAHSQLAEDARRRAREALTSPVPPTGIASEYAARLRQYSESVAQLAERYVMTPGAPDWTGLAVALGRLAERYEAAGRRAARRASALARSNVEGILDVSFRATFGRREGEAAFVQAFGRAQVQLLRNINAAQIAKLQEVWSEGPDAMRQALWVSRNRAGYVAHNEVWALSHDVMAYWAQEAGSTRYQWITRDDPRVRPGHARLHKKTFAWTDPPDTGRREGRNHPGHAAGCRCQALPLSD